MATPRVTLTEARMKALAPPRGKPVVVYDAKALGLAIRWRPNGKPRWYVVKRAGGRMAWVALGDISDWPTVSVDLARRLAGEALVKLAIGEDPVQAKADRRAKARGGRVPMADALARHLAVLRERGRSGGHVAELERVATAAAAAGVRDLAAPGVASTAAGWLDTLDVSDQTLHRYRAHLIAVGKTAVRWWPADVLPREPFLALTGKGAPMPAPPYFTPAECAALVADDALAREDSGGRLWAFLLYTGCRFREATWARWDRLDLDRATFAVIPPDAAEHAAGSRVKRNKARTVGLQAELLALLRTWPRTADGFLFPTVWRDQPHVRNVFTFRDHLEAISIPLDGRRIHSLRHAHAVLAVASGEDSLRLRLSMGHAGEAMQSHYASAAMRWRAVLADWRGVFRLRDAEEVARLTGPKRAPIATEGIA